MSEDRTASALARAFVRTPSISGEEEAVARLAEDWCRAQRLAVTRDDAAVSVLLESGHPGPSLLLASHFDTVPPGEGWEVDPFAGVVEDGILRGRGAVDAKSALAAMFAAAALLRARGLPRRGRLVVLGTYGEETRDTSMPRALARLPGPPDAAIVGEPTALEPCVAQRGLLVCEARWHGEQMHAGWAAELPEPPASAIAAAARDLARLAELRFERRDPWLGAVVVTPTQVHAGVARNVTPPLCEALLDVRTTPAYEHDQILAALRATLREGEVTVASDRLRPAATPEGSALLAAFERVRPGAKRFGSPTCSDWTFLRGVDGLKLGPGDSRLSHTAHEAIPLDEIDAAAELYAAVAEEYLR